MAVSTALLTPGAVTIAITVAAGSLPVAVGVAVTGRPVTAWAGAPAAAVYAVAAGVRVGV